MFANLLQLITRRPPPDFEKTFVEEVHVTRPSARNPRTEKIILAGWILIVAKSFLMIWLVDHYHLKFNANWVIMPTVASASLCTFVYFFLRE
ncbi:MAG: hypothetical protein JWM32_2496 [Verrucomicrobia bacterium]|nr:hypothetical protein [Verrucomicrobiota bacterium]